MKLYMFRAVLLSIIRSLFTVQSAMVYVIQVCRQLSSQFHPAPARKLSTKLYDIPLLSVQWINSWWWTDELPEICRVSWQNKFVKLVLLVGFIIKKILHEVRKHQTTPNVALHILHNFSSFYIGIPDTYHYYITGPPRPYACPFSQSPRILSFCLTTFHISRSKKQKTISFLIAKVLTPIYYHVHFSSLIPRIKHSLPLLLV